MHEIRMILGNVAALSEPATTGIVPRQRVVPVITRSLGRGGVAAKTLAPRNIFCSSAVASIACSGGVGSPSPNASKLADNHSRLVQMVRGAVVIRDPSGLVFDLDGVDGRRSPKDRSRRRPANRHPCRPAPITRRTSFVRNLSFVAHLCSYQSCIKGVIMIGRLVGTVAVIATLFLPVASHAQGVPGGVERGARDGERAAGPVGAVVGGAIGGVVGGVSGVLGVDERPRFRSYVVEQRRPSYQYREDVRVGAVLSDDGVTYYDVPPEYGVREYRYTVVNGRTVLVEPRTRRIVEIVE